MRIIKIKRWLLAMSVSAMVFGILATASAQNSNQQAPAPADFVKMLEKAQQEQLERLKQENPQAYQEQKAAMDRQKKIQEVTTLFFQGKLPLPEAKAALSPFVKQQMQEEGAFSNLGARIQRLEERLAFLKKAKLQPELLVQERVDQMLGKSAPLPLSSIESGLD